MTGNNSRHPSVVSQPSKRERIVDWLGAQGPSLLTIYMCGAVALIAYLADTIG
jgi:hypothetical protein